MGYGLVNGTGYMGGWSMVFGGFMMFFWLALLVILVVLLVRWLSSSNNPLATPDNYRSNSTSDALTLLRGRYARGEIDTSDFEERVQKLQ